MFFRYLSCFCVLHFVIISTLSGQTQTPNRSLTSPTQSSTSLRSSPQATPSQPMTKPQTRQPAPAVTQERTPPIRPAPPKAVTGPSRPTYFYPGVLVWRGDTWEGGDQLVNLSRGIGVYVEILKPQDEPIPLSQGDVQKVVEEAFSSGGITPNTFPEVNQPPLPFFQMQIFLYPIGTQGYAAFIEGRLFESVGLNRVPISVGIAYQAITWERKSLILVHTEKAVEEVLKAVNDIAQDFGKRVQAYRQQPLFPQQAPPGF